jgi:hypothetical protein
MKLPCVDVEADVDAVEIVVEEEEVATVVCTVSTVHNNRTDHNGICVKIPCTDEEADVDAVETVEEEK